VTAKAVTIWCQCYYAGELHLCHTSEQADDRANICHNLDNRADRNTNAHPYSYLNTNPCTHKPPEGGPYICAIERGRQCVTATYTNAHFDSYTCAADYANTNTCVQRHLDTG